MPEAVTVECGFCHKHFRCPPEVQARSVRCPYCKTIVKIPGVSEEGRQAIEAMNDIIAAEKADRDRVPMSVRHRVAPPPRGIRSRTAALVWAGVLGAVLIACGIGVYVRYGRSQAAEYGEKGAKKAPVIASKAGTASAPAVATPGAPAAATPGTPGVPTAAGPGGAKAAAPAPPPEPMEPITLKVDRFLGGFKDETITYVVGHVKNNTAGPLKVIKVKLGIADKEDKDLGEATQTILNLPAGASAPLVAEWPHAEGVIGKRWFPNYDTNSQGVPDLPAVTCDDVVAVCDPNNASTTGKIKVRVTNQGVTPLPQVQFYAILISAEGKIAGIAKATVDVQLPPKKPVDVSFPWTNCSGHLVHDVEVWAQAGM